MAVGVVLATEVAVGTVVGGIVVTGELERTVLVGTELTCGCGVGVACGSCVAADVGVDVGVGVGVGVDVSLGVGKIPGTVGRITVEASIFELIA
jgi:hypothetical protein